LQIEYIIQHRRGGGGSRSRHRTFKSFPPYRGRRISHIILGCTHACVSGQIYRKEIPRVHVLCVDKYIEKRWTTIYIYIYCSRKTMYISRNTKHTQREREGEPKHAHACVWQGERPSQQYKGGLSGDRDIGAFFSRQQSDSTHARCVRHRSMARHFLRVRLPFRDIPAMPSVDSEVYVGNVRLAFISISRVERATICSFPAIARFWWTSAIL